MPTLTTRKAPEIRWTVVKDYYKDGNNFTDTWVILYGTEQAANEAKTRLEAGQDKSWFDPEGNDYAGYEAFLYVDKIHLTGGL